ncbi:DUF6379 domain-containing protein [Paracoccus sp. PS-1]|uniref:C-glycoside deglycosidase beta subunit domain-containing protein n=1 Tax=unclassified Paracoccus (in: a-proteobacteria) TaxID=2688777 RepID=UPI00048D57D3|nr:MULTISPECIES: DUF6379 domain-containing protein [unclassified Paracoccus (in: a-proteobacteria)]MDQ7261413.1 DUF6379 domain-containing protein [Paracoccus sp. PS1]
MFDQHIICPEGFRNVTESGEVAGFRFLARLPYYRGLGLSMIEDLAVTVDGEAVPREAVRLSLRGRSWTLDQLETVHDDRWDFGEKAEIVVTRPGGLAPGKHKLKLAERLRISYLPFVPTTAHETELTLEG